MTPVRAASSFDLLPERSTAELVGCLLFGGRSCSDFVIFHCQSLRLAYLSALRSARPRRSPST